MPAIPFKPICVHEYKSNQEPMETFYEQTEMRPYNTKRLAPKLGIFQESII